MIYIHLHTSIVYKPAPTAHKDHNKYDLLKAVTQKLLRIKKKIWYVL